MSPNDLLSEFKQLLGRQAPDGASETRALLNALMTRFNLVSREEFDAQTAVLARTRAKLEQLQRELEQLQKANTNP
ncbi:accessory factor UbiK family protein [Simiduia sp. 21SJ11W-1]|uniref:accessory factor UbiK family protein n=1 Tax=Simiduia sp. 21SJ11W-1 TaxID=2909669 RepID=UPI0020A0F48B|nr:accessory factor UbiK family protein [Simiduia sp. 21SJ11W-1]UTA48064.1 accessory factor UbiK family protein [Simiduia sp. 21SJ11W-1]